jgi:SNF2 family DNA or RNA helicase
VLHAVHWRRVVLDEAHVIANPKAKQSRAVMMLQASRRWVVTGTPLQNKIDDLMALFTFLRIEPLDDPEWFRRLVGDPSRSKCQRRQAEAMQVVRSVLAEYCLRRTKEQRIRGAPILRLPKKTEIVRTLQFSEPERALYDQLFQSGKAMFRTYMREGSVMTHYTKILERLLRLRQLCNHPSLLPTAANHTSASEAAGEVLDDDMRKLIEVLESRMASGEEEVRV